MAVMASTLGSPEKDKVQSPRSARANWQDISYVQLTFAFEQNRRYPRTAFLPSFQPNEQNCRQHCDHPCHDGNGEHQLYFQVTRMTKRTLGLENNKENDLVAKEKDLNLAVWREDWI